ncbi:hypothetical protein ABW19_dt0206491 [Dactylella cylindrospora]|nr:hypothetical protein ABW19_dt0206491 [Dactylella cylindrospora]
MSTATYRSPYGPKLKNGPHIAGWTFKSIGRLGFQASIFGGTALLGLLFLAEPMPRIRRDILQKIPVLGPYWIREIPPSDNPF